MPPEGAVVILIKGFKDVLFDVTWKKKQKKPNTTKKTISNIKSL